MYLLMTLDDEALLSLCMLFLEDKLLLALSGHLHDANHAFEISFGPSGQSNPRQKISKNGNVQRLDSAFCFLAKGEAEDFPYLLLKRGA